MNPAINQVRKLYAFAVRAANSLQSLFLLFVRVYWGSNSPKTVGANSTI